MILIYGATGLAAKAVAQRLRGDLILAGRDEARLKRIAHSLRLPYVVAGLDDAAKLARQCRVLVNCAGPFAETALPLARACIEAKTHYVDISGERTAVERLVALDARASAVVPAAGAKGALGAWARDDLGGDAFEIAYAHAGSAFWSPSPTALVSFAREVSILLDPKSTEYGLAPRVFDFPAPFVPGMAVLTRGTDEVPLPGDVKRRVRSWLCVDPGMPSNFVWAATHSPSFVGPLQGSIAAMWRAIGAASPRDVARLLPPPGRGALGVVVEATHARMAISAADGYEATAATVALCVEHLDARGVLSPAQLIPGRAALRALARAGAIRVFTDGRNR